MTMCCGSTDDQASREPGPLGWGYSEEGRQLPKDGLPVDTSLQE